MHVQRELLEDQLHLGGIGFQHGLQLGGGEAAVGALEIGEFDERDGRVRRPGHGRASGGDLDGIFEQFMLRRMREAGGFGIGQRVFLVLSGLKGCHDYGGQPLAVKAVRILDAALRYLHAAAAGTVAGADQFERSGLLRGG